MPGGSFNIRRLTEYLDQSRDAFGKQISDGTRNSIDVPSFYTYNPERLRYYANDTRTDPTTDTRFSDREGDYLLEPNAGDKLEMHTAERPRYVVGYEAVGSAAAMAETQLGAGDQIQVGLRDRSDPENLAYFELNGDSPNRLVLEGQGAEVASTEFEFPGSVDETTPLRYEIQFNWYNVGRYLFTVSYTDSGEDVGERQRNYVIGELTVDDDFATGDGAYHVYHEIDASTSGQALAVGSYGYSVLGNIDETTRTKAARLTDLSYGGSGEYEALAAVRIPDNLGNVYCQFKNVTCFPNTTSGELLVIVVQAGETDATGFGVPPQQSESNTVVRQTTNVTEFPDSAGSIVTSTSDPNGYQVGFTRYESSGDGNNRRVSPSESVENKRPLYEDDVAVFLYKADSATSDSVNVTYFVEQDW